MHAGGGEGTEPLASTPSDSRRPAGGVHPVIHGPQVAARSTAYAQAPDRCREARADGLGYSFTNNVTSGDRDGPSLNQHALFYGTWAIGGDGQSRVYSRLQPEWLVAIANLVPAVEIVRTTATSVRQDLAAALGGP